jgi:hypothetical protein
VTKIIAMIVMNVVTSKLQLARASPFSIDKLNGAREKGRILKQMVKFLKMSTRAFRTFYVCVDVLAS